MKVTPTIFKEVFILEPQVLGDDRGYFMESYRKETLSRLGVTTEFVQDNQSRSISASTLRGLHFQLNPKAQTKIVRCVKGALYDVIVDLRSGSPTYGKWMGLILSESNHLQLVVPKGFAHGFCTVVPDTVIAYKVDAYYCPECDGGILWNDPDLGIDWPTAMPILSEKDRQHPRLVDANLNFTYQPNEVKMK